MHWGEVEREEEVKVRAVELAIPTKHCNFVKRWER